MKQAGDSRPIGVFDSGVGGLTVVKQLMALLPRESILYFGDTARIPYGTKSEKTILRFAFEDSVFLLDKNVKMIVVACNTASAIAIPYLQKVLNVPVLGMITPGAEAAVQSTNSGRIGVIGTASTIRSNSYRKEILTLDASAQVILQACPLFVPLVEEGWIEDEATYLIARRYLQTITENKVDTLILGCTHYPLLKDVIQRIVGPEVHLIDSGVEAAREVKNMLLSQNATAAESQTPVHRFYLSDLPYKFQEIGERFLEQTLPHVETVNFEEFLISKGERFWKEHLQFAVSQ